jgi:hypothetical protein
MRLVLTLMIRDEIDIIETNLRYHLSQGFDHLVITDNGSVDGTRDVLGHYARRYPIELIDEPATNWAQYAWVTRMAVVAHEKLRADWVFHADADEFLVWPRGTVRQAMIAAPQDADVFLMRRHDFVPVERPMKEPPPAEMVYRKAESRNRAGKRLPPKIVHRGTSDITIFQGNHRLESASLRKRRPWSEIEVYHFPIRSWGQFCSKVQNIGSGYSQNQELPKTVGKQRRDWYDRMQAGALEAEYQDMFYGPERLVAALKSGEIVQDETVRERIEQLG